MKLEQLESLIVLAQSESYARAAEKLFISQPGLSYIISTLESELGFSLFERVGKKVRPTPAGAVFLERARHIVDYARDSVAVAARIAQNEARVIRLGHYSNNPDYVMARLLSEFARIEPGITPSLRRASVDQSLEALQCGDIDALFMAERAGALPAGLVFRPLLESDTFYWVVRKDHPLAGKSLVTMGDLEGETLLLPIHTLADGVETCFTGLVYDLYRDCDGSAVRQVENSDSALILVLAGAGIAIMPPYLFTPHPEIVAVPFERRERIVYGLANMRERESAPALARLVSLAQRLVGDGAFSWPM